MFAPAPPAKRRSVSRCNDLTSIRFHYIRHLRLDNALAGPRPAFRRNHDSLSNLFPLSPEVRS